MPSVIFFDFDGVIVESADIKTNAFRKLFEEHPEVDEIVRYHEMNAGVSRYDKFDYIYEKILNKELSPEEKERLGKRFSEIVLEEILRCPIVSGTLEFLRKHHGKTRMIVISATPDAELKFILKDRKIEGYFDEAYGSPAKKHEIISRTLKEGGLQKTDVLFIGDSINDYEHARKADVPFVGRLSGKENPFPEGVRVVRDFFEFDKLVDGLE